MEKEFHINYKELDFKVDKKRIRKLTEDAEADMRRQRRLIMEEQQKEKENG